MNMHSTAAVGLVVIVCSLAAPAQVTLPSGDTPGLSAPVANPSAGALIDTVPRTPGINDPLPAPAVSLPLPLLPPVTVNPAAGVVPVTPGAVGPVVRPELGRSAIDSLQFGPAPTAGNALSPADAAQRQLMIERENRMRSLSR